MLWLIGLAPWVYVLSLSILQERAKNLKTETPPKKVEEEPLTDHAKLAKSEKELRIHVEKYGIIRKMYTTK